jgi:hypothetical protein
MYAKNESKFFHKTGLLISFAQEGDLLWWGYVVPALC